MPSPEEAVPAPRGPAGTALNNAFAGRAAVVTGAAGFIGSHLCERLLSLGAEVIGVDNLLTGRLDTIQGWFLNLASRSSPDLPGLDLPSLLHQAQHALQMGAVHLPTATPRLLHGDWVGRHVFADSYRITGIVDLESVRGGDPLAELAGWSLREPAVLTEALLAGYFDGPVPDHSLLPLVLFRLRIAVSLLHHHASCDDQSMTRLRAAQIQADLDDLDHGGLHIVPRVTPDGHSPERRRP